MTKIQKRQLQAYLHFKEKPMSVFALVQFNWRMFAILVVLASASVGVMLLMQDPLGAWFVAVAYGAILLRDIGNCIRWSRTWPLVSQVLDWPRVEKLAVENEIAV